MELSGRKKILAAVVGGIHPHGGACRLKTVAQTAELGCSFSHDPQRASPELASMGYLEQPHASAGSVPTPQGYRMYVNELMQRQKLSWRRRKRSTAASTTSSASWTTWSRT